MAKEITTELTRQELAVIERKTVISSQSEALASLPPVKLKNGELKLPSKAGLIIRFNTLVKQTFGISCDEIDKAQDVYMSGIVRSLRDEFTQVVNEYKGTWDETEAHYNEMKAALWELPKIAFENYQHKLERMRGLKNV